MNSTLVSLCRSGCESWLTEELAARHAHFVRQGDGWIAWQADAPQRGPAPGALIFERQRLPDAHWLPMPDRAERTDALAQRLLAQAGSEAPEAPTAPLRHVYAADTGGATSRAALATALERTLQRLRPKPSGREAVWQVCVVTDGLWWSLAHPGHLVSPHPGGVHRMARDPAAPSRSVLKIEEALEWLATQGLAVGEHNQGGEAFRPRPRQRVIDLGAAPGGWSYAFLKRGCRVLAVDNGPLKLAGLDALPGSLEHLRADGLRLRPPAGWLPADWMLSDMLVAPGVCLGLLRKWIEGGWMHRCIVNVKLPQRHALQALQPLMDYLSRVPGLRWRLRQLYHDRREVTLLAALAPDAVESAAPRKTAPSPSKARGKATTPAQARAAAKPGRKSAQPGRTRRPHPSRKPLKTGRGGKSRKG